MYPQVRYVTYNKTDNTAECSQPNAFVKVSIVEIKIISHVLGVIFTEGYYSSGRLFNLLHVQQKKYENWCQSENMLLIIWCFTNERLFLVL